MAAVITIFDDDLATINRHVHINPITGTAIIGVSLLIDDTPTGGQALANEYLVNMAFASGEWQVTVQPTIGPDYAVTLPLGTTEDAGSVIEGVQLFFAPLSTGSTYSFLVVVGYHAGLLVAGSMSAPKRLFAKNTGSSDGLDALALIRPDAHFLNITGALLNGVGEADLLLDTRVGPYTV
ncbi:MAG: hypothetical protein ABI743_11730, partial [bacterium]